MNHSRARSVPRLEAKIRLVSDPRLLRVIRGTIESLTAELGWNESDSRAITLAVEEALTNKIRHAYKGKTDGIIQFEFRTCPDSLVFRITDQGDAPDEASICSRERDSTKAGGFGTHIIRDVMDSVTYQVTEEGNRLTMVKYLPNASQPPEGTTAGEPA